MRALWAGANRPTVRFSVMSARTFAAFGFAVALLGWGGAAYAIDCPGNPDAIGTSRTLTIDASRVAHVGTVSYRDTLPLADREVVLTFDDGPMPPYTNRILDVLASQCIKANYFIIGRMARGYPDLLKRIYSDGHVIGTHSENHVLGFDKMPLDAVRKEVEQGIASIGEALGEPSSVAPFFRIPGLLRSATVDNYLRSRQLVTFSADVTGDDWRHIPAQEVVRRTIARLDEKGRGIVLLHDIQPATALALPNLLKELKGRGYRIVQVRPLATMPALVASNLPSIAANRAAPLASAWPTAMAPPRPKEPPPQPVTKTLAAPQVVTVTRKIALEPAAPLATEPPAPVAAAPITAAPAAEIAPATPAETPETSAAIPPAPAAPPAPATPDTTAVPDPVAAVPAVPAPAAEPQPAMAASEPPRAERSKSVRDEPAPIPRRQATVNSAPAITCSTEFSAFPPG